MTCGGPPVWIIRVVVDWRVQRKANGPCGGLFASEGLERERRVVRSWIVDIAVGRQGWLQGEVEALALIGFGATPE